MEEPRIQTENPQTQAEEPQASAKEEKGNRIFGSVKYVGKGTNSFYAYVSGSDGKEYCITEKVYSKTERAAEVIQKGKKISFVPEEGKRKPLAVEVRVNEP